jgi:PadR family transcriptional regulator PadR
MDTQLKKGVLELCVLSILFKSDCYGYELVEKISKNIKITEGTIYPILKRLVEKEYFTTYLKESKEGPPRKYYKLTELGISRKKELEQSWYMFVKKVNATIQEDRE